MNHKIFLPVALVFGLIVAMGVGVASAASLKNSDINIVDRISTKFNLNRDEVAKVFEEEFEARHKKHTEKINERIDQAVKDGKLSQDLADQLKSKLQEVDKLKQDLRNTKNEDIQNKIRESLDELNTWLDNNGIPRNIISENQMGHHRSFMEKQ